MAKALELAVDEQKQSVAHLRDLQEHLIAGIEQQVPMARLNGPRDLSFRVPGNVNFSFAPVEGEALVLRMDLEGIGVSSGSACHSGQLNASHVLLAMGASVDEAKSTLRFSLGRDNTSEHIDTVLDALPRVLKKTGYFRTHAPTATIG
jgi:cysteine desulfurase